MKFVDNVLTVLGQCFDLAVKERPALLEIQGVRVACHAVEEGRI